MGLDGLRLDWPRSDRCVDGASVEIAFHAESVYIRDSKHPAKEPLEFTRKERTAFRDARASGGFRTG
jgi:hypothetical protein